MPESPITSKVVLPDDVLDLVRKLATSGPRPLLERMQPYLNLAFVVIAAIWTGAQFYFFSRVQDRLDIEGKRIAIERSAGRSLAIEHTLTSSRLDGRTLIAATEDVDYIVTSHLTIKNNSDTKIRISKAEIRVWKGTAAENGDSLTAVNIVPEPGLIEWGEPAIMQVHEINGEEPGGGPTTVLHPGETAVQTTSYVVRSDEKTWVGVEILLHSNKSKVPNRSRRVVRTGAPSSFVDIQVHRNDTPWTGGNLVIPG